MSKSSFEFEPQIKVHILYLFSPMLAPLVGDIDEQIEEGKSETSLACTLSCVIPDYVHAISVSVHIYIMEYLKHKHGRYIKCRLHADLRHPILSPTKSV